LTFIPSTQAVTTTVTNYVSRIIPKTPNLSNVFENKQRTIHKLSMKNKNKTSVLKVTECSRTTNIMLKIE